MYIIYIRGSILEKHIIKYDIIKNLEPMVTQTPNIYKWTSNVDIDKELLNELWNNLNITDKQKSCLIKFRTRTYMGHAIKQLSLEGKDTPPLLVLYATHTNQTHGYMYYSHVDNNTYTHFTLKDTTKLYGK